MPRHRALPVVDPRPPRGAIYRTYASVLGATRPAMWFSRTVLWKIDPHLLRLSGGRVSLAVGIPRALLETRGARSGELRRHPVIYFHDGGNVTIVASKFGDPENPSWFHNALGHPDVVLGGEPYRAHLVEDVSERARLWGLADTVFPPFAVYRARAATVGRTIPILQLTPRS